MSNSVFLLALFDSEGSTLKIIARKVINIDPKRPTLSAAKMYM